MTIFRNYNKGKSVLMFLVLSLLMIQSQSLSIKMAMDTTSTDDTISSYYSDVGFCSCDRYASACDPLCCCDTLCSSTQISLWSSNKLCLNSQATLQSQCSDLSKGSFLSFEDLACVYYSNRGNISYFFSYPDSGSINYPAANKFVAKMSSAEAINALTSAANIADSYTEGKYLLKAIKNTTLKYWQMWVPVAGGSCSVGYLNISQGSSSYSCDYLLTASTCPKNTQLFTGTVSLCKNGACLLSEALPTVTAATVPASSTVCQNMITSQTIDITLSSSGKIYTIDSISVTFTKANVDFSVNPKYQIKTTVNVKKAATAVQYSGNPGYVLGKPIVVESSNTLYSIADASGNCVATGSTAISLNFGQNTVFSCQFTADPCANSIYVDQIAKLTGLKLQKWAKGSVDTISVAGTSSTINTCKAQTITLNILYSNGGWKADMQNYIIGAEITTKASTELSFSRKYFKVNWIYVDPDTISSPPTNMFYTYFSYMWKPLRDYFGAYQ